jgi:peroxisomal 2,4-dienoyl-CoA reductase
LTQSLAVELGPKGIRVNGIVPGAIDGTAGFDKLSPKDSNKNSLASVCPLQRLGTKEDISNAALFLASDASSFISGHNIVVDGASKIAFPNFPLLSDEIRNKWSSKL